MNTGLRGAVWIFAAGVASSGCSVPYSSQGQAHYNRCSHDEDCVSATGDLYSCDPPGICVASSRNLPGLFLEVRPLTYAPYGANQSFLTAPQPAITLPPPVTIEEIEIIETTCAVANNAVPAQITFYPSYPYLGPPADALHVVTTQALAGGDYLTSATLTAGSMYDLYIEPQPAACGGAGAPLVLPGPPTFQRNRSFGQHVAKLGIDRAEQPIITLSGLITDFPSTSSKLKWRVDVVEPTRGLPISIPQTVSPDSTSLELSFTIPVTWQDDAILRLSPVSSPPDDVVVGSGQVVRPTIYWALATPLILSPTAKYARFSVLDLALGTANVHGTVVRADGVKTAAELSIQSTSLTGVVGSIASLSLRNVPTTANGTFDVALPPGKYNIEARSAPETDGGVDGGLGSTESVGTKSIQVFPATAGDSVSLSIPLATRWLVNGYVENPGGARVSDVEVSAIPFAFPPASYFWATHPPSTTVTGAATTAVSDDNGIFNLPLDEKETMSLFVRPPPDSNYPWLVCPNQNTQSFRMVVSLPFPTLVFGTVTTSGDPRGASGAVVGAQVNAWLPYNADAPESPDGVGKLAVRVGSTTTGPDGTFQLLLSPTVPWLPGVGQCPGF